MKFRREYPIGLELVRFEDRILSVKSPEACPRELMFTAKQHGYSDAQLANAWLGEISPTSILAVRAVRKGMGIEPVYKLVDTCAAEFEAALEDGAQEAGASGSRHSSAPAVADTAHRGRAAGPCFRCRQAWEQSARRRFRKVIGTSTTRPWPLPDKR